MSRSIAIVIESLGGGGAQHVAAMLANTWAADGVAVTVGTFQGPGADVFKLDGRVGRVVIGGNRLSGDAIAAVLANWCRIRALRASLKTLDAATVLAFVGSTNILTVLASTGLGRRVVISERNDPARQSLGRAWDWLRKRLYPRADLVVANSRNAIATMAAFVPSERLLCLPNPLRVEPAHLTGPPPVSGPFFLAAGRLTRQKGYDILIEAFASLAGSLPSWRLALLGDGPLRGELERKSVSLGLADRVHFAGYVENPFPWYWRAAAFVHPARFEGLPNAVIEAMSCGLPVVISDAQEGLRDFVTHDETGLIVAVDSAQALAEAMTRLAGDPKLRGRLGAAGCIAIEPCRADKAVQAWTSALGLVPR